MGNADCSVQTDPQLTLRIIIRLLRVATDKPFVYGYKNPVIAQ